MPEPAFLVVRLGSLGDIVHTLPAIAALRQTFPASRITWLAAERWRLLVESSGLGAHVEPVDTRSGASARRVVGEMRRTKWESAIDFQGLWKSAVLTRLSGASRRIGFGWRAAREFGASICYTDRVVPRAKHVVDQNGELALRAGATQPVAEFHLQAPESDSQRLGNWRLQQGIEKYCVISPGGGWRAKCWPPVRYGELCRWVEKQFGVACVVNIGAGEEPLVEEVQVAAAGATVLIHRGSLGELMALLGGARFIVGGDTGPLHLAAALGTPVIGIYGPTDPARNGPYGGRDVTLRAPNAITSHRRRTEHDPSILAISVEQVQDAIRQRLGREQ
ncbi:MAG: glycosyltransferase family 9 protein [Candidatus Acidiferrales bacterium]